MALSYEKETFGQHHSHGLETGEIQDASPLRPEQTNGIEL